METKTIVENGVLKKVPLDYQKPKPVTKRMTKDELRELALERIAEALQSVDASLEPEVATRIAMSALDRIDGKPGQAITVDQTLRHITVNANIEFVQPARDKVIEQAVDKPIVVIEQ